MFANLQDQRPPLKVPKDPVLAKLVKKRAELIWKYHDHDTLLENQADEDLSEADRNAAWREFEREEQTGSLEPNSAAKQQDKLGESADARAEQNEEKSADVHAQQRKQKSTDARTQERKQKSPDSCKKIQRSKPVVSRSSSSSEVSDTDETLSYQPFRRADNGDEK